MSVPATNPQITGTYYVSYQSPYSKGVAFNYINDPNMVLRNQLGIAYATGGFRPMSAGDFGSITLTGANIMVDDIAVTGGFIAITNTPSVTIATPVVAVSGVALVTNALAITGGQITIAGGAVAVTGTVTTNETTYSSVTNSTLSGSASAITTGIALASTPTRNAFYVQVVGSGSPLFILYGNGTTSATNFNVLLKADSSLYGGNGGVLSDDAYTGPISVSGGIGCLFTVWQA